MRFEIASVSPCLQALITCGTKLKLVQSPATMPRAVGHHACIIRSPAHTMIKNSPKAQEFPAKDVPGHHNHPAPRSPKAEVAKALLSLAPAHPLVQPWPATNAGSTPALARGV